MIVTHTGAGAETQAEGEAGSMHREPDVGFDPRSPGSRPGPKAGAKLLRHPGIPPFHFVDGSLVALDVVSFHLPKDFALPFTHFPIILLLQLVYSLNRET